MQTDTFIRSSFRDPEGRVFLLGNRVIRVISKDVYETLSLFLQIKEAKDLLEQGQLVKTKILLESEKESLFENYSDLKYDLAKELIIAEHEKIAFPSFPYEWSPDMLCTAGLLTLDLATKLVPLNYGLKDATPYNVLFRGPNPVFIDLLSIEPRDPFDYVWMPYAQFMRTFMLPLQVNKYFNIPMADIFTSHRDGIEPEFVYHLTDILQKFMPAFFASVSIPVWLAKGHNQDDSAIYRKRVAKDVDRVSYTLSSIFRGLQKRLQKTQKNRKRKSTWSHYESCEENYTGHEHELKATTIQDFLSKYKPKRVLDIGCNTGIFSVMAARAGASVTSIDFDPVCIGRLWEKAHELKLDILPLVIDIARPSAQIGWRNREHASFLERANQHFDCVLMLAVIHHLLVTERIPLSEIIELAVDLTTKYLVIEYIGPEDRMFKILTRGREHLYTLLDRDFFEQTCQKYFEIAHYQQIDKSSRWLYILIKK